MVSLCSSERRPVTPSGGLALGQREGRVSACAVAQKRAGHAKQLKWVCGSLSVGASVSVWAAAWGPCYRPVSLCSLSLFKERTCTKNRMHQQENCSPKTVSLQEVIQMTDMNLWGLEQCMKVEHNFLVSE